MKELLNSLSSDNLVLLCVIMGIVALFLAIAISIEIYNNNKRFQSLLDKEKNDENSQGSSQNINLTPSEGIKYVEEDSELEKTKAKMELASLREKLKKAEAENKDLKKELVETKVDDEEDLKIGEVSSVKEEVATEPVVEVVEEPKVQNTVVNVSVENNALQEVTTTPVNEEIEVLDDEEVVEEVKNEPITIDKKNLNLNIDNYLSQDIILKPKKEEIIKPVINENEDVLPEPVNVSVTSPVDIVVDKPKETEFKPDKEIEVLSMLDMDYSNIQKLKEDDSDEENAIISYDELKNAQSFGYTDAEMDDYMDEKDAIISIQELEKLYNESSRIDSSKNDIDEVDKSLLDYKMNPVVVPEENKTQVLSADFINATPEVEVSEQDLLIEQTANLEKLNDEIRKTNEFLKALKDLKKNLE